jgi:CRISPR-associated protein Cas1
VGAAKTLDELRGLEGQAAKEYFGLVRRMLKPPVDGKTWGFERRAYYPPPDPVNALLSFGYTLLLNDLIAACQLIGLDPYLGFFHAIDYGRPSMALDLEEEFRPVIVDSIVLTAVNRRMLGLKDFEKPKPEAEGEGDARPVAGQGNVAIYLTPEARNKFVALYESRVNEQVVYPPLNERTSYRRVLELQAQQMARVILGQAREYRPVEIR